MHGALFSTLAAARHTLGLEEHSLLANPGFTMPDIFEFDYDPAGPAGGLNAGPAFAEAAQ
jgi:hypothetical protein